MHWAPMVAVSISASTEGALAVDGKYAKKPGCPQCVMPGRIDRPKSAISWSVVLPSAGGDSGNILRMSPGFTSGVTGSRSMPAM